LYADASSGVFAFPIATASGLLGGSIGAPVSFGTAPGPLATFFSDTFWQTNGAVTSQTVAVSPVFGSTPIVPGSYLVDSAGVFPPGTTVQSVSADQSTITLSAAPIASVTSDGLYFESAFIYVADLKSNTITTMIANPFTGQLTPVGKPLAVAQTPTAIQVTSRPNLLDL
jgi:hypothetical protein